ncbi:bifunctional lysylphosphatidylglycerol flippase/synthetase MprF [Neoactinobaculum massilliense]|uniref:bifunctional lysylphosphatidylglycerol flippase/synthetase MprF n=1 Tax=Neoactinobaculum massilliense TaxID=2364794 RepID=UPI000F521C14|nr:bifunctional lysylphosphatidylglycerol flippase/synthetase MprF [Neoactinobaculum massilliense]
MSFLRAHSRLFKILFTTAMIIAVALVARSQLSEISGEHMRQALHAVPTGVLIALAAAGLLAFTATGLYDVAAARHYRIHLPWKRALEIGWVAQAFNNFAGLGGLTGGAIRARYYKRYGAQGDTAVRVSVAVWAANLMGLFVILLATLPFGARWDGKFLAVPVVACLYIPIYFLAGRIHLGKVNLQTSALADQSARQKLEMTGASVVDWLAAAVFFWLCVSAFQPHVSLLSALFVYATATLVGLMSFIPAGLGSFDVAAVALFSAMGHDSSRLLLALIIYRVAYYAVPWALAALYWSWQEIAPRLGFEDSQRRTRLVVNTLSVLTLVAGIILVVSALTPEIGQRVHFMRGLLPPPIMRASHLTVLLTGVIMVVLSRGIHARVERAYRLTMVLIIIAAVACVARGLDWEEATYLLIFGLLLVAGRTAFDRQPLRPSWRSLLPSLLFVFGVTGAIVAWHLMHGAPHGFVHGKPIAIIVFNVLFAAAIALAVMYSRPSGPEFIRPGHKDVARFRAFIEQYGGNAYTHLFYLGDKQVFYSSDGAAALLYRPQGNLLIVLGDPFGDPAAFERVVAEFVDFADNEGARVCVYELEERHLGILANEGFSFIKLGEDASVDLSCFSLVGNQGKPFRRMRNRMKELSFELVRPPFTPEFLAELREVSDAWLGDRTEMGFSLGFFDPAYVGRAPVAVMRSATRLEGFATLMPMGPGVASVDLMRIRPDAPAPTMDGLFVSLLEQAKELGYRSFDLGMAPMSNTGVRPHAYRREKIVRLVYDYGNRVYNFSGLRSYKEKFHPAWRSRYLVYPGASSLASTLVALLDAVQHPDRSEGALPLPIQAPRIPEHEPPVEPPLPGAVMLAGVKGTVAGATAGETASGETTSSETMAPARTQPRTSTSNKTTRASNETSLSDT